MHIVGQRCSIEVNECTWEINGRFYKGENFYNSLFVFLNINPLLKRDLT